MVCSDRQDLSFETELLIQMNELLFRHAYLQKVMDDKKSWLTQMAVLDQICHHFFLNTNSLQCQPTTSQFIKPLAQQILALVAAAIHCTLFEYASGKKTTFVFFSR